MMQKLASKVMDAYIKSSDDEFVELQMKNKSHPVVKLYDYLHMRINPYATLALDVVEPRGLPLQ